MEIKSTNNGNEYVVAIKGQLDTLTAPQLSEALIPIYESAQKLTLDFKDLTYISSAGLRICINSYQILNSKGGRFVIINTNDAIRQIFKLTKLDEILDVE